MELPKVLLNAVQSFSRLPGVGEKTATRQALYLSNLSQAELHEFGESIKALAYLKKCEECGMFSDGRLCDVCSSSKRREERTLCIVENIVDCMAIERSGQFRGLYHVLGGVLNPLMGIGPNELNLNNLFNRIKNEKIMSIILAVNPSVEGDATCAYIKQNLSPDMNVERIGFGIPIGGNLEYLDAMTISKALENRRKM